MNKENLIKKLGFISSVVIPVLTLAVTSALTYLKETNEPKKEWERVISPVTLSFYTLEIIC